MSVKGLNQCLKTTEGPCARPEIKLSLNLGALKFASRLVPGLNFKLGMDGINCKILSSNRAVGFKIRAYSLGLMRFSVLSMYLHLWPLCCMPLAVLGLLASSSFNWKGATWVVTQICIQLFQFEF